MSHLIDRRVASKRKSAVNRQRFLKRYKSQLKRAVADAVNRRSIVDTDTGEKVKIPSKDVSEPVFSHGPGGTREGVYPGNREFVTGDQFERPPGGAGGGSGSGEASDSGEGEDEFAFELSHDEYLDLLFDDLELPNLIRNQLVGATEFKTVRAGYSTDGSPSNIDVVRSLKGAIARRTALAAPYRGRIRELEEELEALPEKLDSFATCFGLIHGDPLNPATQELIAELKPEDYPTEYFRPQAGHALGAIGLAVVGFGVTLGVSRLGRTDDGTETS